VGVTAVLRLVVAPDILRPSPFLLSAGVVMVSALVGGLGPGILATVGLAVLAALGLPPVGELSVGDTIDLFRIGLFIAEGAFVASIGALLRRQLIERRRPRRLPAAPAGRFANANVVRAERHLAEPLSARELEVMRHVAAGLHNDEIAATMFITTNTVKSHLAHAYAKLEVTSRTQAVARCAALGLLDTSEPASSDQGP
jgi:DNA-binding CsgD family transcriptional regulator